MCIVSDEQTHAICGKTKSPAPNLPDLILLYMMLPKVSGLDVLRALKGDVLVGHIPVIVLSGLNQANETKLLTEGGAAFLMISQE